MGVATAHPATPANGVRTTGRGPVADTDNWPHTKRTLPWLLTAFLVMLFLVPFDRTNLKVQLPFNSKLDRFFIAGMLIAGLVRILVVSKEKRGVTPRRMTAVTASVILFTAIALLSIVLNIDRIFRLGELTLVEKQVAQLLGFVAFYFIVAKTVRPGEVRAFGKLVLTLACMTAFGTLIEARTGINIFYRISSVVLKPIANVAVAPTNIHPTIDQGRKVIVGPTDHGLALASLLTIALPFALVTLISGKPSTRRRLMYFIGIGAILAAALATGRKTAILAPIAAMAVLVAYNPRLLRWTPVALIALVPIIHVAAPGALGTFGVLSSGASSGSTQGRVQDYGAIAPDIEANVAIGRGYGSLDPDNPRWYRILDNQYLGILVQTGVIGLLGYLGIVIAALISAHGLIKRGGDRAPPILAAAAGCAAYGLVSGTYDALSFPQAPYSFFFAAGLIAAAAAVPRGLGDDPETPQEGLPSVAPIQMIWTAGRRRLIHAPGIRGRASARREFVADFGRKH
jgi:O-antigen ligase